MNSKETCLRILSAESEQEVDAVIQSVPELSASGNWYPIDNRETNFNVVTNQASTGSKALTELCTNMVDAILLKQAHLKGIDPTGSDAPKSVTEAVRELVKLKGARSGVLAEVDDEKYLQEFAEKNLVIGITGSTRRGESLCFTFTDNGEGQRPDAFEDTFLSLSKGNKSNIPFVQGKYNMGSSGVLTYCGKRWYKLIVSRRYDGTADWGWTLVRRRPGGGTPIAEYFKADGRIPWFEASDLYPMHFQNGPNKGKQDEKVSVATGTVVKLYDYQMESASDFRYVREALNQNLVSTALPFRLMDYTVRPQRSGRRAQGVDERSLYGMEFILLHRYGEEVSRTEDDETLAEPGSEHHVGEIEHPELGHISVKAIVLKKDLPGWLHYRRNTARVFHVVNGQVQFTENRAYLSQNCKLPGLKDRMVVIVDASNLSETAHNDVWKGDREKIRATSVGQLYRNQVTGVIENSTLLKDLQRQFAREETDQIAERSRVDLFQNLVDNDPSIAQLLPGGTLVKLPGGGPGRPDPVEWQGKYSPTFLEVVGREIRNSGAEIAVNGTRTVTFKTDAVNGYLNRLENRGRMFILPGLSDKCSYTHTLLNGNLTVKFQALENRMQPGEELSFSVALLDDAMPEPVSEELRLRAVETRQRGGGGGRKRRDGEGDDDQGGDTEVEQRNLPPSKWLTRDGRTIGEDETEPWPEDFNDQDGGKVEDLDEGTQLYYINYDNAHFRRVLDSQRTDIDKRVVAEQYRIGMLVTMLGMEDAYTRMPPGARTELGEHIDDIRRLAAQGAATVMMSIAKTLPTIVNPAAVADPDE